MGPRRGRCGRRGGIPARHRAGLTPLRLAAKPVPVLCLAVWAGAYGRGRSTRAVCAGLLLSAVGDALLEASPRLFLAGLLAFLAAHVAYIAGFVRETRRACPVRGVPFAVWGVLGYVAMRGGLAGLRAPVVVYLAAICVMMWRAAALPGHEGPVRRFEWLALAGAVLFGASDTLIGLDRFRAPLAGVRVPIITLYWLGQLAIAASTVASGDRVCSRAMRGLLRVQAWLALAASLAGCGGGSSPNAPAPPPTSTTPGVAVPNEGWSHVPEGSAIAYRSNPPASGPHYPVWLQYREYTQAMARGYWVHNLEHGAIVFLYHPDAPGNVIPEITDAYRSLPADPRCGHTRALLTPDPLLPWSAAVVAADFVLRAENTSTMVIHEFAVARRGRGPEQGCEQGTRP